MIKLFKEMIEISDIIDFNELKNRVNDKDIDKFEDYIYSLYYTMGEGKINMLEFSRKIQTYMEENNISQEKFLNIQKKIMERYGLDMNNIDEQIKAYGVDTSQFGALGKNYEEMRKTLSFQEKYKGKVNSKAVTTYYIKNSKNNVEILMEDCNVILKSFDHIDLTDNELNEFLCSYKKLVEEKPLNISICENTSTYIY
ncbi:hypothetical protein M918_13220 [Clostridium sp. BL8]|nr:hypothetical protein M918_13220 [Clostridium sp. BL8]